MKFLTIAFSIGAANLACGCMPSAASAPQARPAIDTARIVDAIKSDEVHWNNDWKSGDPGRVAGHFAPNATVMLSGFAPLVGAKAIRGAIDGALQDKAFAFTFTSDKVDVARSGDLAAARGTYSQTATDPKTGTPVTTQGDYVTVYKPQAGGAWKAVWDIATPGAPAPAA